MEKYGNGFNGFKVTNVRVYDLCESMVAQGYPMMTEFVDYDDAELFYDEDRKIIVAKEPDADKYVVRKVNEKVVSSLAGCESGSGHDNFLKGILVAFDLHYPVYWTPQFQRYSHASITSSSSSMWRLTNMDMRTAFTDNTPDWIKSSMKHMVDIYNAANKAQIAERDETFYIVESYPNKNTDREPNYTILRSREVEPFVNDLDLDSVAWKMFTVKEFYLRIVATCPQGLMKTMRITTNALQLKTMIKQRKHHKLPEWHVFCEVLGSLPFWDTIKYNPLKD